MNGSRSVRTRLRSVVSVLMTVSSVQSSRRSFTSTVYRVGNPPSERGGSIHTHQCTSPLNHIPHTHTLVREEGGRGTFIHSDTHALPHSCSITHTHILTWIIPGDSGSGVSDANDRGSVWDLWRTHWQCCHFYSSFLTLSLHISSFIVNVDCCYGYPESRGERGA